MEIDFVFKIAGIGLIVTVMTQVLNKAGREDISTMVALSGLVIVLMMVVNLVYDFFDNVRSMFEI